MGRSRQLKLFRSSDGLIVDLFAGGGGASVGIEAALGRPVDIAINHSPTALAVHRANHPHTLHLEADIWEVKPREATHGRPVALLWLSPDCTHFSVAKGGVPRNSKSRSLAWVGIRWAKEVRPTVIALENVIEFLGWGPLDADGRPCKSRKGQTFRAWKGKLEALGYSVEYRVLDSSLFGAPTRRRRLFLIARCDGRPIVWPEPTHGPGRRPLHVAAECIDWSIPCPSIFDRKKPLAEKTMWRTAMGVRRFVLDTAAPFIVKVNHGGWEGRGEPIYEPLSTVTAQRRGHALVAPTLIQTGYGERKGQSARVPGLDKPLGTVVGCGQKHALVAAFISQYFNGQRPPIGKTLNAPLPTVTAWDHNALAAVALAKFNGNAENGHPGCCAPNEPMPTVTAGGIHVAQVLALLARYGGPPSDGVVVVDGATFQIVDIGLRMLEPHELLRAQFGEFAAEYDLSAATTKAARVRLIGNSVCPQQARAIVAANIDTDAARAA